MEAIELLELQQYEAVIERGLKTFVEVGNALLAIRDKRLYRAEFGTFEKYCLGRWGMTRQSANRMIQSSEVVQNLNVEMEPIGSILPQSECQARPLTALDPEQQREVWREAVNTAPQDKDGKPRITGKHVTETKKRLYSTEDKAACKYTRSLPRGTSMSEGILCQLRNRVIGDVMYCYESCPSYEEVPQSKTIAHVAHNSGDNEWYTPKKYIDAVMQMWHTIDLDPASTAIANEVIGASSFYNQDDNGLLQEWRGNVWMNPPYATGLIGKFCNKLIAEVYSNRITAAIVLVNNATETQWFHNLMTIAECICFPQGRVKFWSPGKVSTPLQGQAIIYIGTQPNTFADAFAQFGVICYVK